MVDKARNLTQKAVVSKVKLIYPEGTECVPRPPESRLFRSGCQELERLM